MKNYIRTTTKNTVRNVDMLTGKRKYKKNKLQGDNIYSDKIKENIEDTKLSRIQYLHKIISHIYDEYPFLDKNTIDKICLDMNMKIIENIIVFNDAQYLINNLIIVFPFLQEVKTKLEDKYRDDIFGIFSKKPDENIMVIVNDLKCFTKFEHNGKILFLDNTGNVYDQQNIFIGFKKGEKIYFFYDIIDILD